MSEILTPGIREWLWHKLRADLAKFVPEFGDNNLLMCPGCGRRLPQEDFGLEHIIPKQAVKLDPPLVRADPNTPVNVRTKNLLLCKKPLVYKGIKAFNNGCNSWKGKYFDSAIADLLTKPNLASDPNIRTTSLVAALVLAYLAMVQEYGFIAVLSKSGQLMRRQFFSPSAFLPDMPTRHQMVLGGQPFTAEDAGIWDRPFSFTFKDNACFVTARHFVVIAPASFHPDASITTTLKFVPEKYKFRPHFQTAFD